MQNYASIEITNPIVEINVLFFQLPAVPRVYVCFPRRRPSTSKTDGLKFSEFIFISFLQKKYQQNIALESLNPISFGQKSSNKPPNMGVS